MEHPQGVLSQREQEKVDDPARESMGAAPRRMLMTTMASTLGEKLENVQNALRGGVAAAAIGAAAMGGVGHAVAADNSSERMEEIPTLSSLQNHARGSNDASKSFEQTINERVERVLAQDPKKLTERMEAFSERFSDFTRNLREFIDEQPEKGGLKPDDETAQKKESEEAQARMETENVRERFHQMISEGVERVLDQDPNKLSKGLDNLIEGLGELNQKVGDLASARFENTPSGKEGIDQQIDSAVKQRQAHTHTRTR